MGCGADAMAHLRTWQGHAPVTIPHDRRPLDSARGVALRSVPPPPGSCQLSMLRRATLVSTRIGGWPKTLRATEMVTRATIDTSVTGLSSMPSLS
jgi:hypothetical protein